MSETRDEDRPSRSLSHIFDGFRKLWQTAKAPPSLARYFQKTASSDSEADSGFTELLSIDVAARHEKGLKARLSDDGDDFPDRIDTIQMVLNGLHSPQPISEDRTGPPAVSAIVAGDHDETLTATTNPDRNSATSDPILERIGRYDVERVLGAGAFGRVYLARDTELQRRVAIKVPHQYRISSASEVDEYLAEARTLASLDHIGVVPIYDFDRMGDRCYVVSKYVEGETLAQRQRRSPLPLSEVVPLLSDLAMTLQYVHSRGVVHRDIKPSNLLLSHDGRCIVTDFGLALREFDTDQKPGMMGTVNYMSPEQARGEAHLVDGRSDLFSLGVVMYELLTGVRPFSGDNWQQTTVMICEGTPAPLRQHCNLVPGELERICLKLLSKRASGRYECGKELAEDLHHFIANTPELPVSAPVFRSGPAVSSWGDSKQRLVGIVPRGLRSFDREDSVFFRELLPGARNRDGVPNSLVFWKRKLETQVPEGSFRVGVLYGPSGSGKSSFIKAGLLPILDSRLTVVFVEAAVQGTEARLIQALQQRCPEMPVDLNLKDCLAWLRRSSTSAAQLNVVIIIDQFEQWLHSWNGDSAAELCLALRQCDGRSLRSVLLVRDDFWLSVSRFADDVEIELVPGQNLGMVDLFDKRHAKKVLAEYGRAYGRLPFDRAEMSNGQLSFLARAVDDLAEGDRVIPIQLAAFSEIMKDRDWNPKSLQSVGGVKGVGTQFLEEAFHGSKASAQHRSFENAAQAVLRSLLPEAGSNIKGAMRSETELRFVSGFDSSPRMFDQLMRMLDTELRLVTPASSNIAETPADSNEDAHDDTRAVRFYQLTHDFLVPAVRSWLNLQQGETISGRANLRMIDRAEVWNARPTAQHLPSWLEWVTFLLLTRKRQRDFSQQKMMVAAGRRHFIGTFLFAAAFAVLIAIGVCWDSYSKATAGLQQLLTAQPMEISDILDRLQRVDHWSHGRLTELARNQSSATPTGLRARLALLRSDVGNQTLADEIFQQRNNVSLDTLLVLRKELAAAPVRHLMIQELWDTFKAPSSSPESRLNAAVLLAEFDAPLSEPSASRWQQIGEKLTPAVMHALRTDPRCYAMLAEELRPIREILVPSLRSVLNSPTVSDSDGNYALSLTIDLWRDQPKILADVYLDARKNQIMPLVNVIKKSFSEIRGVLLKAFHTEPDTLTSRELQERVANRRANAAALLLAHHELDGVYDLLRHHKIPNTRSQLIERAVQLGVPGNTLLERLSVAKDSGIISGLLLALGTASSQSGVLSEREALQDRARKLFETHPRADVHSAAEWTLKQLGDEQWLAAARKRLGRKVRLPGQNWQIEPNGLTMIDVQMPEHMISISAHEVTMEQYRSFFPDYPHKEAQAPYPDCPVIQTSWFQAVDYCRWLTEQEGMTEEDQCYPNAEERNDKLMPYPNFRQRRGYRMPTLTEFRTAYFGDVQTRFHFGQNDRLIEAYDCTELSALGHLERCGLRKPSHRGFFNLDGNVSEWCTAGAYLKNLAVRPIFGGKVDGSPAYAEKLHGGSVYTARTRFYTVGFRVMRLADAVPAAHSDR